MEEQVFKVRAQAKITLGLEFDIKASDSFDNARSLGATAIYNWVREKLREAAASEDENWPYPSCDFGASDVKIVQVKGTWEPMKKKDALPEESPAKEMPLGLDPTHQSPDVK